MLRSRRSTGGCEPSPSGGASSTSLRASMLGAFVAASLFGLSPLGAQEQPAEQPVEQPAVSPAETADSPSAPAPAAPASDSAAASATGAATATPATPSVPISLSDVEEAELGEILQLLDRYNVASREHRQQMGTLLKDERDKRLRALDERFLKQQQIATQDHRARHSDALMLLERFVQRYPDDQKWTPSVMFRLATAYLDQAGIEYELKQQQLSVLETPPADATETAVSEEIPAYSGPDYTRSINLWREIARRFPRYRQLDGTLYLLAYYLGEMGMLAEAKGAYKGLVCGNKFDALAPPPPPTDPDDVRSRLGGGVLVAGAKPADPYTDCDATGMNPKLVDEAWVRLGEMHFDTRYELPLAIAAFRRVASNRDSEFFDVALYKLAWSFYRNDQFIEGINAFDELVVYADKQEELGGRSVELRPEAIDYIAISFADPWEKGGQPDPSKSLEKARDYYKKRMSEKHARDVFEKLGDTLRAGDAYDQSIAAWRTALENWPLNPRNPLIHQKIVDALADKGDPAASMEERSKLAMAYSKGSDWYVANETNRDAMDLAAKLAEQSLLAAAKSAHRNAQLARQEWDKTKTADAKKFFVGQYSQAAKLYHQYLLEYPTSSEVYELTYRLADCYYFSEAYVESVPHYRWVRDHRDLGTKYFEPAALSIVQAFQKAVDAAKTGGALVEPPLPSKDNLTALPQPQPIPDLYRDLQKAYDEYMSLINDEKTAPKTALASAMISFRHLQLDESLGRFQTILDRYCKTPEAVQAKEGVLFIHQARGDDAMYQVAADTFISRKCGEDKDVELARAQKLSKEYEIAAKLYKEGNYERAAKKFYTLFRLAPDTDENRDDALFSSAIAAEKAGKPKTAIAMYLEFSRNPQLKDSEYFVEALYRTAVSYQDAFDYDSAVDAYLRVFSAASEPGRKARAEFDLGQAQLDSLWNAAVLREQDRVYYDRAKNDPGAIVLYQRYASTDQKDRKRAREAAFRAALIYEKANDTKNMIKAFGDWRKTYGADQEAGPFYVLSYYKTAKVLEKAGDLKGAKANYEQTIKAFDMTGEAKGSPSSFLAGESEFWLSDQVYKARFEGYKVKWPAGISSKDPDKQAKAINDALDSLAKITTEVADSYHKVARFESGWSLAASVRLGDVSFFAGQKLI
ncbi:MAG: tetratricopeptide repeat protein, partial [Pseudomonadota bacterium]